ncbi:MAG: hypothetical protein J0L92_10880 [Deltaproteobacteria bacterium]|nr:hypothetical protein [Deltaproteobacteria bacterium]
MLRLLPALFLAVLVVPTSASAQEASCVCGVSDENPYGGWGYVEATESLDPELLMDRAIDPSELETPDPHTVRGIAPRGAERPLAILYCTHGADPRCSPLAPEDRPTPRSLPRPTPVMAHVHSLVSSAVLVAFEQTTVVPALVERTDPSDPHVARLERPPRG